jgi:hypothetical protein
MKQEHVIFCDPEKDKQVRQLFRSISPQFSGRSLSPRKFRKKVYPKLISHLKMKEDKLREARRIKEQDLINSTRQINYTAMWSKSIKSKESKPFLERAQERVHKMWDRYAVNAKKKQNQKEIDLNECTFKPNIDEKAKSIGPRSIRDLYKWDEEREQKISLKQKKKRFEEMRECRGKFRSPKTRKQQFKELKESQKYLLFNCTD